MAGGDLAGHKSTAADLGAWLCREDESGQGLRPPKGRTWGRRGHTPVVTATGGHDTRVSLAALIAVRPGCRPRLIWRTHRARRGDTRKGFTETDYARLLDAAHQQLDGPVVLVWDGLNTHVSRAMAELVAAWDWLGCNGGDPPQAGPCHDGRLRAVADVRHEQQAVPGRIESAGHHVLKDRAHAEPLRGNAGCEQLAPVLSHPGVQQHRPVPGVHDHADVGVVEGQLHLIDNLPGRRIEQQHAVGARGRTPGPGDSRCHHQLAGAEDGRAVRAGNRQPPLGLAQHDQAAAGSGHYQAQVG